MEPSKFSGRLSKTSPDFRATAAVNAFGAIKGSVPDTNRAGHEKHGQENLVVEVVMVYGVWGAGARTWEAHTHLTENQGHEGGQEQEDACSRSAAKSYSARGGSMRAPLEQKRAGRALSGTDRYLHSWPLA